MAAGEKPAAVTTIPISAAQETARRRRRHGRCLAFWPQATTAQTQSLKAFAGYWSTRRRTADGMNPLAKESRARRRSPGPDSLVSSILRITDIVTTSRCSPSQRTRRRWSGRRREMNLSGSRSQRQRIASEVLPRYGCSYLSDVDGCQLRAEEASRRKQALSACADARAALPLQSGLCGLR